MTLQLMFDRLEWVLVMLARLVAHRKLRQMLDERVLVANVERIDLEFHPGTSLDVLQAKLQFYLATLPQCRFVLPPYDRCRHSSESKAECMEFLDFPRISLARPIWPNSISTCPGLVSNHSLSRNPSAEFSLKRASLRVGSCSNS